MQSGERSFNRFLGENAALTGQQTQAGSGKRRKQKVLAISPNSMEILQKTNL